jgi:psp operon transcriptional activator
MLSPDNLPPLIGQSAEFLMLLDRVSQVAPVERPVLVIGERGTGKELIGARLHFLSTRWSQEYVKVNCAALSEDLLESELFGHEAGAFTGAKSRHAGRFERADGGTIFLDEIANASLRVQEKILRIVEYGEFERIGGEKTLTTDVRVVGATNADLPKLAKAGKFRADLLDRLAFEVINLPPLRVRWEDIPILAQHFAQNMVRELGEERFAGFRMRAMRTLMEYGWPGNIRELKNAVERAVSRALSAGSSSYVDAIELDPFTQSWGDIEKPTVQTAPTDTLVPAKADPSLPFAEQINTLERHLIEGALTTQGWHQGQAAKALGLSYDQIRHYMRKHGVKRPAAQ